MSFSNVWLPSPFNEGVFGMGGESVEARCDHCGDFLSSVGVFPDNHFVVRHVGYCFQCGALTGTTIAPEISLVEALPHNEKNWCSFMSEKVSDTKGQGTYTQGQSPIDCPMCEICHARTSMWLHVDSVSHEDVFWDNDQSMILFQCEKHADHIMFVIC